MDIKKDCYEEEFAYLSIAKEAFEQKKLANAIEYYLKALQVNFNNSTTHSNLALCYFKTFDYRNSLEYCEVAQMISQKNIKSLLLASKSCYNLYLRNNDQEKLKQSKVWIDMSIELSKSPEFASFYPILVPVYLKIEATLKKLKINNRAETSERLLSYFSALYGRELVENIEKFLPSRKVLERHSLCCPITIDYFKEPVCISTGHTYEKQFLVRYCTTKGYRCPSTNKSILPYAIHENKAVKLAVTDFLSLYPWLDPENKDEIDQYFM